jgi:hypothetical protein
MALLNPREPRQRLLQNVPPQKALHDSQIGVDVHKILSILKRQFEGDGLYSLKKRSFGISDNLFSVPSSSSVVEMRLEWKSRKERPSGGDPHCSEQNQGIHGTSGLL